MLRRTYKFTMKKVKSNLRNSIVETQAEKKDYTDPKRFFKRFQEMGI